MTYEFILKRIKEQEEYIKKLPRGVRTEIMASALGTLNYFLLKKSQLETELKKFTSSKFELTIK